MIFCIDFANGIDDNTLFVNYISSADCANSLFAVHFFHAPRLVGLQNSAVGIGNKMERQFILQLRVIIPPVVVLYKMRV